MNSLSLKKFLLIVVLFFFTPLYLFSVDREIKLYYTASLNGNLLGCDCSGAPRAGLSRTAVFLNKRDPSSSLLVDLGDLHSADYNPLLSDFLTKAYQYIGYDFIAFGDQETASGLDVFLDTTKKLKYLCSNLKIDGKAISKESIILYRSGIKIGITSVIAPETFYFYPKEVTRRINISPAVDFAKNALYKLEKSRTNINILLFHGYSEEAKLIFNTQGWDVVLFAHEQIFLEKIEDNKILVSPGEEGNRVGCINIVLQNNKLAKITNSFTHFDYNKDSADDYINELFNDYEKEVKKKIHNSTQNYY